MKDTETKISFMERHIRMEVNEYSCRACDKSFYFIDDDNDLLPPTYCPLCGRKHVRR